MTDLEYQNECIWAYVAVNGVKYCGVVPTGHIENTGNHTVKLEFHADQYVAKDGFEVKLFCSNLSTSEYPSPPTTTTTSTHCGLHPTASTNDTQELPGGVLLITPHYLDDGANDCSYTPVEDGVIIASENPYQNCHSCQAVYVCPEEYNVTINVLQFDKSLIYLYCKNNI